MSLCVCVCVCVCVCQVIAQELVGGASRNGTAVVRVFVENENDVNPIFERAEYNTTISEDADLNSFVEEVLLYIQCTCIIPILYISHIQY